MPKLFLFILFCLCSISSVWANAGDTDGLLDDPDVGVSALVEDADHSSEAVKKATSKLQIYGFARSELFLNTRQNYESRGGLVGLFPKPIELDGQGNDINAQVNGAFLSINTRLGLRYDYQEGDLNLGARIEGDFCGTLGSNDTYTFRLRHAMFHLDYLQHHLIVGQFWHPFYGGVFPNVLTLNAGSPFALMNRSPQITYKYEPIPELGITAAFVCMPVSDFRPEAVLGVSFKKNGWDAGLMGEYRYTANPYTFAAGTPEEWSKKIPLHSFCGTLYGQYATDKWYINARIIGGQNLSHMIIHGGFGLAEVNEETGYARFENINQIASYICASYGDKWVVNVLGGYVKNLGTQSDCIEHYGLGEDVNQMCRAMASVEFNYKGLNVALEEEFTGAEYGNWTANVVSPSYFVYNFKTTLRIRYYFDFDWSFKHAPKK